MSSRKSGKGVDENEYFAEACNRMAIDHWRTGGPFCKKIDLDKTFIRYILENI